MSNTQLLPAKLTGLLKLMTWQQQYDITKLSMELKLCK